MTINPSSGLPYGTDKHTKHTWHPLQQRKRVEGFDDQRPKEIDARGHARAEGQLRTGRSLADHFLTQVGVFVEGNAAVKKQGQLRKQSVALDHGEPLRTGK